MKKLFTTKKMALMGVITALSVILYFIEVPLPFIAPDFYKLDLSDIPIMIGSFILGPVAGVIMELVKNLIHLLITRTGGVGELANFAIGCAFVLPASIIYKYKKTVHGAIVGLFVSILCMAIVGGLMNYFVMLPLYGVNDQETIDAYYKAFADNHDGMLDCGPLVADNEAKGNVQKPFCDGLVLESIGLVEAILKERGLI